MNDLAKESDYDRLVPFVDQCMVKGLPPKELHLSDRDKNRIKAIIRTWKVYKENPFVHVRERLASAERMYISSDFLPTALQLFEHIRTECDAYDSKSDKHLAQWGARLGLKIAASKGDAANINRAVKQISDLNNGFQEEEDNSRSRSALPIILVHATTKNPESVDYTDAALEEEMNRWGATIDPSFKAARERSRQLEARSLALEEEAEFGSPSSDAEFGSSSPKGGVPTPSPSFLTDDLFQEYD